MLKMILAVGGNGEIGQEGKLPWSLPEDLNYFKEVTSGATVVMGGNTFRSLEHFGGHGLPNRDNVVLTREVPKLDKTGYRLTDKGVLLVNEQYLQHTLRFGSIMQDKDMFLIGGSEMYNKYAHMCDEYHISLVEGSFENADKFFDISSIWESTEDKEVIKFDGFKVHVRVPKSVKDDFDLD
jgi:dihydrofolate reductase